MRETLGSQGVQTLLGKLKDQERRQRTQRKKENRQKIKETLDPMILLLRTPRRRAKKQKKDRNNKKNQGDFSDAGNGDDFTGGVDESVENPIPIIRESVKWDFLIW